MLEPEKFLFLVSKTVQLHAPSIVKEAIKFWLHSAAIMFTRPSLRDATRTRRPDLSAWKRLPVSFQA
ncbi:MAG: hypothetical protein ACYTX0_23755 [Nostoc sp.]